jgi:hypothetical protein
LLAPFAGVQFMLVLSLAGFAWSAAFGLFALLCLRPLVQPRVPRGLATFRRKSPKWMEPKLVAGVGEKLQARPGLLRW